MSRLTVTAVITSHDRAAFLPEAVASALTAGADEVLVVRNFSETIPGLEGRYRDLPCPERETGIKHAVGVEGARGDLVAFLDDDDTWVPEKLDRVRARFSGDPSLVYYCHGQTAIDAEGRPVDARHPEFRTREPAAFPGWDRTQMDDLFDRIWPGNNSSTVVRRSWALGWTPLLRSAGWAADRVWITAALLDRRGIGMDPARLTRLRLHDLNMSHARVRSPAEFRERHGTASHRFARACTELARTAAEKEGPASPIAHHFSERAAAFQFFADLEDGTHPRRSALRELREGPGRRDRGAGLSALVTLISPALARRLLFQRSRRRWRIRTIGAGP